MKKIALKTQIKIFLPLFLIGILTSCSNDDYHIEIPEGEHEEPVKIILNFESLPSNLKKSYVYQVSDGETEPPVTVINLTSGVYKVNIQFFSLNGDDLTDEIFDTDKDEHFVYFSKLNNSNVSIAYADDDATDSGGNKIGRKTIWTLTAGNTPQFVYLIHQPAVKDPNALSAGQLGGEIDLEAHFEVESAQ
ncbi:MAG: hypothetical protein LBT29_06675 [Flavobacteriaceae bacterium]|jgi:hypothetical protein|nr:hypothetical protein [Flavobacteriaceae bacterium]